jgi:hypothetical protein
MVAGSHLHFDNDHNVSRINGNPILNKMMAVWHKSVKWFWSYHIYCVFCLLLFYGCESEGWQESNAAGIQDNSVLSKITPVWSRYLKRFKSYSIFKCWSSEIQDDGQRPKWQHFSALLGRSISIVKRYICANGDVCSICRFVTMHFVTYRHTLYRHPSIA